MHRREARAQFRFLRTFADHDLLAKVTAKLPTAKVHWVEGGDHSLNRGMGKEELARTYEEVIGILSEWVSANQT